MKLCIVTHKVAIGDGQGRVNYEVAWEAVRRRYQYGAPRLSKCATVASGDRWCGFVVGGTATGTPAYTSRQRDRSHSPTAIL